MPITYIILTALIFVFHILYKGDLSFILLIVLILMPIVLFVLLTIQAAMLKISVDSHSKAAERGKPEILKITLNNPTIFPIAVCRLTVRCKSFFPPNKPVREKYSVTVPIGQKARESVTLSFIPKHCGYMDISLKSARISDMLGLTSLFKRVWFGDRITVLPVSHHFAPDMEQSFAHSPDSDVFSPVKPGDDPSEIFQLREYHDGDSMNRIHWKLSGRSEDLIVKELSQPISSKILILCDLGACKTAESSDKVLDMTATLANFLSGMQTAYTIAAAGDDAIFTAEVSDSESLFMALTKLCCGSASYFSRITEAADTSGAAELMRNGYSHVLAVSAESDKAFYEELLRLCGETRLTIFCTLPDPEPAEERKDLLSAEIIYSDAESLEEKYREFYCRQDPYSE